MENVAKWVAIAGIVIGLCYFTTKSEKNELQSKNYLACVDAMQKAIPDPNDPGRASFLQNCKQ